MPHAVRRAAAAAALLLIALAPSARAATAEKGTVFRAGPVSLYVEVRGSAPGTPLVVVNGGPGFDHDYVHCSDAWDVLARKRRVVFYDQRGNGRSGPLPDSATCTLADQIADLDSVRAHLGLEKMDLLGHSWGGYLVMAYAARHPERIAHLIIVDSAAPKWSDTAFLFKDVYPEAVERQEAVAFAEALGDTVALHADLHEYLGLLFYSTGNRDRFLAHAADYHYDRRVNETLNADLAKYDLNPELRKFRFPTLVLTGRFDMNVAPRIAWEIHKAIPGSEFTVFEKSGHLPYFEEPDAFVKRLESFLDRKP
ncbi:MAG: alpha/beta fold hydrolase [Hyphomicrobiales bacterium]